jgi:hypothetical protein
MITVTMAATGTGTNYFVKFNIRNESASIGRLVFYDIRLDLEKPGIKKLNFLR